MIDLGLSKSTLDTKTVVILTLSLSLSTPSSIHGHIENMSKIYLSSELAG